MQSPLTCGLRSASSAYCIAGISNCHLIRTSTAWPPLVASLRTMIAGSRPANHSSCPSKCSAASSAASSSLRSRQLSTMVRLSSTGHSLRSLIRSLRLLAQDAVPKGLGGLFQAALRWTRTRAALSRKLHSPRRHLQPPTDRSCLWQRYLPVARFRTQQPQAHPESPGR